MFPINGASIPLPELSTSYIPENPCALSLQVTDGLSGGRFRCDRVCPQPTDAHAAMPRRLPNGMCCVQDTLRQQLSLKRAAEGTAPTPTALRANSSVPSVALLACEAAHLWQKEAVGLKDAIISGSRARELNNIARLRAILASSCLTGGRTSDSIMLSFASAYVMTRVVRPADGSAVRVVPTKLKVPVSVLALSGASNLHAVLSQPGLVGAITPQPSGAKCVHSGSKPNLGHAPSALSECQRDVICAEGCRWCMQVVHYLIYKSKRLHHIEVTKVYSKPVGGW